MLLIDSLYINNSGGKVLLDYLVTEIEARGLEVFYLFDDRCADSYAFVPQERKHFLKAGMLARYKFYKKNISRLKKIFCFANLPPPLKVGDAEVFVYFHNVSLLEQSRDCPPKEKFLKKLKALFVVLSNCPSYHYVVQTGFVKRKLRQRLPNNNILVMPFFKSLALEVLDLSGKVSDCFVYVSNGNTHKNHLILFDAWEILAEKGIFPELHLTITDDYVSHCKKIFELQDKGIRVINHGFTDPIKLYRRAMYAIYPSLMESFGLGLAEAVSFGCEVLGSDLEYLYEVCEPLITFDPLDARDIALKVQEVLSNPPDVNVSRVVVDNKVSQLLEVLAV